MESVHAWLCKCDRGVVVMEVSVMTYDGDGDFHHDDGSCGQRL